MSAAVNTLARPAKFDQSQQHRRSMIAKINIARQQLNMVEDDYRQGLLDTTGQISLRECSDAQLERMLGWLKTKGFQPLPGGKAARHPMAMKARALWISLYHLGVVHNSAEQALEAFAKRQLKCDRLNWARQSDGFKLIEALKDMATRNGWAQTSPETGQPLSLLGLQAALCNAIMAKLKAAGHVPANWALHDAMWKLCGEENARPGSWTPDDYGRAAAQLGAKLRQMGGHHGAH